MYILTLWFLPSFAHYFKKLSAALDSKRVNLNSVEENLTFNALILSIFLSHGNFVAQVLGMVRVHAHPNFMILTIFRPLFYETFSSFGQHKNQFEQCRRKFNFQCTFYVHARLRVVLKMYILTLWFLPSFAHYFMKPSAALDSIRIDFNIVEENLTFNALLCPCTACPRAGSVSMYILTLWFLPSFAHYFKKLSAALDSIRVNLNSVEENLTFNALILSKHGLDIYWFREHVHPNFGHDSYHLSPIILWTFQQLWTA